MLTEIADSEHIGQVKVSGEVWSAKSDSQVSKGAKVKVLAIEGVKLIVQPLIKEEL